MKWISLLVLLISQNAFSYKFTQDVASGSYWQSFPINMSVYLADESEREMLEELVQESADEWEKITGSDIWKIGLGEVTTNFQNNFIRWSDHFEEETGFDGEYTLAVTIRYTRVPYITKMEIILNGNIEYLRNNEDDTLKKTILHEMGHSIGLDHSTTESIMNAYITNLDSLQADDKLGAVALVSKMVESQKKGTVASLKPTTSNSTKDAVNGVNACGSVSLNSDGNNSGGGASGFMSSLILGLMLIFTFKLVEKRKILPSMVLKY